MNTTLRIGLAVVLTLTAARLRADEEPTAASIIGPVPTGDDVDETKVDCDKADQISDDDMKAYNDNPLKAIMGKARTMCTYAQRVAQKSKPATRLPSASAFKQVNGKTVAAAAVAFWDGSDDNGKVQVLGGVVTGSGWVTREMSDAPGVPSSRQLGVAHTFKYKNKCYVAYGALIQKNGNHPSHLPPSWSGSQYQATDYAAAQRIDCALAAKPSR